VLDGDWQNFLEWRYKHINSMAKFHFVLVEHVATMLNFRWCVHKALPFMLNSHWKTSSCHNDGQNKCSVKRHWIDRRARACWGFIVNPELSTPPTLCESLLVTMSLVNPHFDGPNPVLVALMVDKVLQTVFLPAPPCCRLSIIPPMLYTH